MERIVLDPSEVATNRTELDITDWVRMDGVDWGNAEIEAYRASGVYGDTVIDFRYPSRPVSMPLMLKTVGGTAFATIRQQIQAKAARCQQEGMWLKRVTANGGTLFADVQVAGLSLSGGWLQAHKDADTEATLTLECSPDFYGNEIELSDHTETSAAELVFTESDVDGDYPARVRVVVDEDQGQSQLGLMWAFRSKNYSGADTAALAYEAEALEPLDTAAAAALSGASGGTVVTHGTLSTNWTPVLGLNLGGTAFLTHTGTYRMFARYRTTSGTAVSLRSVYDVGDLVFPVENDPWYHPGAGTAFYIADLGELRLQQGPVGAHRWAGQVQGRGVAGGENLSVDRVWFQPVDEGAGILRAPVNSDPGLASYTDRDEFNQAAGALTGKTSSGGKTWAGAGDTDDFSVESTGRTAQRTAVSDGADGRFAVSGASAMTACVVQVDVTSSAFAVDDAGPGARYADTSNYVYVTRKTPGVVGLGYQIQLVKVVAGSATSTVAGYVPWSSTGSYATFRLMIDAAGRWFVWAWLSAGAAPVFIGSGQDPDFATGGALASGKPFFYDKYTSATANTRNYDNFAAWVPSQDAVLAANQSAELRTDGMFREDSTGSAYGPVSWVEGDLPRLPVSGIEGRTVQAIVKASRGNFDTLPDTGIDDISARMYFRPCWLNVPGT